MGKSEVVPMPIHRQDSFYAACKSVYSSLVQTVEEDQESSEEHLEIPEDMQIFNNQVAGHTNDGKHYGNRIYFFDSKCA